MHCPRGRPTGRESAPSEPPGQGDNVGPEAAVGRGIGELVAQLDPPRFADRQAATEQLAAVGKPAIGALAKAAAGDSPEVTSRAIGVLAKLIESSDQPTKAAARAARETIAKSDRPAAASRAQELLKPRPEQMPGRIGVIRGNMIQIGLGGFGNGGVGQRSMKIVNGVKEINAEENGKKVKIIDDPQQGISIEATTKKDGKDVTEKYQAKDAKELEKKHPEGYKLYKEYADNPGLGDVPDSTQPRRNPARPGPRPRRPNNIDESCRAGPADERPATWTQPPGGCKA